MGNERSGRIAMTGFGRTLAVMLCLAATPAGALTGDKAELQRLADGVYAYVGKRNDANAMVIVTTQGVVLVNTANSQPDTRDLARQVASVTDQPVRYVVITQNHGDHIGGVPFFSPPATVIVHDKVARDIAALKPYQIRSWQKRFPERAAALKDVKPIDTMVSFSDRMSLHVGGKEIELIYVDDPQNIGDVLVWLPQEQVLHDAFGGYKGRHPDLRPDYSHGTSVNMLKEIEAGLQLHPQLIVPNHGPVMVPADLEAMVDYVVLARQKVRAMMDQGLALADIEKQFKMDEYKGWDRTSHLPWVAETIWRELQGMGPLVTPTAEKETHATIAGIAEEGRYLTVTDEAGKELHLRISSESNIEGITDRAQFKVGQKFTAQYQVPEAWNPVLGYDVEEIVVTP
jgi:cyclase